jgi:Xaa-Pro aminopeptidase
MIKSPQEIAYLKEACRISDSAFNAMINNAKEGITEKDIQKIMDRTMIEEGSDFNGFIVINSGPERYDMMNPWASDRFLKNGDMMILDFGAVYKGF